MGQKKDILSEYEHFCKVLYRLLAGSSSFSSSVLLHKIEKSTTVSEFCWRKYPHCVEIFLFRELNHIFKSEQRAPALFHFYLLLKLPSSVSLSQIQPSIFQSSPHHPHSIHSPHFLFPPRCLSFRFIVYRSHSRCMASRQMTHLRQSMVGPEAQLRFKPAYQWVAEETGLTCFC